MSAVPVDVPIPVGALLTGAVQIPMYSTSRVAQVSGHLRALISGTFSIDVRDQDDALIHTLSWTSAGRQKHLFESPLPEVPDTGYLSIDVSSLGVGAGDCTLTIWLLPD